MENHTAVCPGLPIGLYLLESAACRRAFRHTSSVGKLFGWAAVLL